MTTTDLVESLNTCTRKASNHYRGFESQNLVFLFLFLEEIHFRCCCFFVCVCVCLCVCHESFMYMTRVKASNLFHSTPRPSKRHIVTAKMRGKLVQQAHCANEIAVEEYEHVVIKLASDSNSSSDTDTVFGLRAYEISLY